MDCETLAKRCWSEHTVLTEVKKALRVTLSWNAPSVGVARKLASLRYTIRVFQRHFERLMELEEKGGYMVVVGKSKPNMLRRAKRLRTQHDHFRALLYQILPTIDSLKPVEEHRFEEICGNISKLLESVEKHDSDEINLIQEALLFDEGGEG